MIGVFFVFFFYLMKISIFRCFMLTYYFIS